MTPIEHIRKSLFKVSQSAFGEIAGTTQASVSRWERGELEPDRIEMTRIRSAASERGIPWDDSLFFERPAPTPSEVAG
jgi:transcriptional regulator with XRE-family HTH domain